MKDAQMYSRSQVDGMVKKAMENSGGKTLVYVLPLFTPSNTFNCYYVCIYVQGFKNGKYAAYDNYFLPPNAAPAPEMRPKTKMYHGWMSISDETRSKIAKAIEDRDRNINFHGKASLITAYNHIGVLYRGGLFDAAIEVYPVKDFPINSWNSYDYRFDFDSTYEYGFNGVTNSFDWDYVRCPPLHLIDSCM